jgi:hypothetical protein
MQFLVRVRAQPLHESARWRRPHRVRDLHDVYAGGRSELRQGLRAHAPDASDERGSGRRAEQRCFRRPAAGGCFSEAGHERVYIARVAVGAIARQPRNTRAIDFPISPGQSFPTERLLSFRLPLASWTATTNAGGLPRNACCWVVRSIMPASVHVVRFERRLRRSVRIRLRLDQHRHYVPSPWAR